MPRDRISIRIVAAMIIPLLWVTRPCSASPYWSIEYLHHDIMRAKENGNRILEVRLLKREFLKRSTRVERLDYDYPCHGKCPDSAEVTRDIFKLEMEVQSNILNYIHPKHIRLIVLDDRFASTLFWSKVDSAQPGPLIAIVGKRGRLEALYPERLRMSGAKANVRVMTGFIAKEVAGMREDPKYREFVDWPNTERILKDANVLPRWPWYLRS